MKTKALFCLLLSLLAFRLVAADLSGLPDISKLATSASIEKRSEAAYFLRYAWYDRAAFNAFFDLLIKLLADSSVEVKTEALESATILIMLCKNDSASVSITDKQQDALNKALAVLVSNETTVELSQRARVALELLLTIQKADGKQ